MLKVITLFVFVAVIQSKTLDGLSNSESEESVETLPLYIEPFDNFQTSNENELEVLISDMEETQQEMIELVNKELVDLIKLGDSNLKIDKELVKKLIENTAKLFNALTRIVGAILAIVKDVVPI